MNLYPDQQQAFDATLAGFANFQKQLLVFPTGGGKTILFSHIARAVQPKRTLILAHRKELIDQAIEKLHRATGIRAGKEKAESCANLTDPVVVASVQTMGRRLDDWPRDHFGLIVCDEAHHAISASWQTVLKHFDANAWVLGVTATPDRGDKKNLGRYFENVAHEVTLFDLIRSHRLSRITVKAVPLKIDLSKVKQSAGDYDADALGDALEPYLDRIAHVIAAECAFRKTLAFLPLINTSKLFVERCQAAGILAEHVDGESEDREDILARFAAGEFDLLSNAMLLTEGYDCPSVDCIVVLRPTRSRSLFSQICGRGTRIAPFKDDCLLLDFLWLHEEHNLIRPAHLIAKNAAEADEITAILQKSGGQAELDLEEAAEGAASEREVKLAEKLKAQAKRKAKTMDVLELASFLHVPDLAEYEPAMKWESEKPSAQQIATLDRFGVDLDSVTCKGHASRLLDVLINRSRLNMASPKQVRLAARLGHAEPNNLTFDQARTYIDARLGRKTKQPHELPF